MTLFTMNISQRLYTVHVHVLTDSAIYSLEPFNTVAIPKSPSFTKPVLVKNMFRVFMSLKKADKNERLAAKCNYFY